MPPSPKQIRYRAQQKARYVLMGKDGSKTFGEKRAPEIMHSLEQTSGPMSLEELTEAREDAIRVMVLRLPEMKPSEVISAVGVIEGEIAARKSKSAPQDREAEVSREEMIARIQGRT